MSIFRHKKFSRSDYEVKREQEIFAEAAKKIDPNKPATEVFKQIQSEHPTADKLLPDIAKDLDKLRKYVVDPTLVAIPSEVRAKVKETPQYRRATTFASMDTPVRFEKRATEAYYYVTPTEDEWPEQAKEGMADVIQLLHRRRRIDS